MGAVYEAEQESPQRTVALKVIRAGYASSEMLRRFENETQALGRLQHPGIAQIYDAGAAETPFGQQPYFAMELVRGETLIAYCDQHQLNVRQRLELMAKICDAVQHAHQRGLIHRDLKPANILVDESGQPRILDFGVARLTDSDAQATRQTDIGQLIGTLAYMSPEQVLGDPQEIDTRSDVYALGVILYELLAGKGPYAIGRQMIEVIRTIREQEPAGLSTVSRVYRGDIETIVRKTLEKDKSRRYASAAELAADLRRYLQNEPIVARPPSAVYQLQKFARRNRALVAGVAAVFVVLVLGIVVSTWEAVQARRAEARAQRASAVSEAVTTFLQKDLLGQASAYNQAKPDPNISVRTVLDRAAQNLHGKFNQQPEVESAIRETIGRTYTELALYPEAAAQLDAAVQLSRQTLGNDAPRTLLLLAELGTHQWQANQVHAGEISLSTAVEGDRRVLGAANPQTLFAMDDLGMLYLDEGKYAEGEALLEQVVAQERRVFGPADPRTLDGLFDLGKAYLSRNKYPQAEAIHRQALATERSRFGVGHPRTIGAMNFLARDLQGEGKLAEAGALFQQALEVDQRAMGEGNAGTAWVMNDLAWNDILQGKYAEAVALLQKALPLQQRVMGRDDQDTLRCESLLAKALSAEGRYTEAEVLARQALDGRRRVFGPDNPATAGSLEILAEIERSLGKYTEAENAQRRVVEIYSRSQGAESSPAVSQESNLAVVYADEKKYPQAEALEKSAVGAMARTRGAEDPSTLAMLCDFAEIEWTQHKYGQAEVYAAQGLRGFRHTIGVQSADARGCVASLTLAYVVQKNFAASEPLAREDMQMEKDAEPDSWHRYCAASMLGESLAGQGKDAEAEPLLIQGYQGLLARKGSIAIPYRDCLALAHQWWLHMPAKTG